MKRVDLFTLFSKSYTYESYLAKELNVFFESRQIPVHKASLDKGGFGNYLQRVCLDPPALTCSFVDLFPGEPPLCHLFNCPHFCWPQKGLHEVFSLLTHAQGNIAVQNKKLAQEIQSLGYSNVHYIPWGVNTQDKGYEENDRQFDIVLFDDLIDFDALKLTWKDLFSSQQVCILESALTLCREGKKTPLGALFELLKEEGLSLHELNFADLLFSLEEALHSEKIAQLIESITPMRIDVFGEHVGNNWLRRLKNADNVYLHWSLPFADYFEILKRSRILVRYVPPFFDGWDEWTLPALNLGCSVLTNGCQQMKEELFQFYPPFVYKTKDFSDVNQRLAWLLKNTKYRQEIALQCKREFLPQHAWKKRGELLVDLFRFGW